MAAGYAYRMTVLPRRSFRDRRPPPSVGRSKSGAGSPAANRTGSVMPPTLLRRLDGLGDGLERDRRGDHLVVDEDGRRTREPARRGRVGDLRHPGQVLPVVDAGGEVVAQAHPLADRDQLVVAEAGAALGGLLGEDLG